MGGDAGRPKWHMKWGVRKKQLSDYLVERKKMKIAISGKYGNGFQLTPEQLEKFGMTDDAIDRTNPLLIAFIESLTFEENENRYFVVSIPIDSKEWFIIDHMGCECVVFKDGFGKLMVANRHGLITPIKTGSVMRFRNVIKPHGGEIDAG